MNKPIDEIIRRTYRYYYEDGLVEMAVGGLFAILGLALWFFDRMPTGAAWAWMFALGLPAIILGGTFGMKWAISALKERVTYPRTGVVTYKNQPSTGRWTLIIAVAVFVIISFFLPESYHSTSVMEGVLLGLILAFMGMRVSLVRLQVAAILPFAGGIFAGYAGLNDLIGGALVFGLTGLELVLFGVFALTRYLRENPPAE